MKEFYYDCFADSRPKSAKNPKSNRVSSPKLTEQRHSSKENILSSMRKMKKQCSTQLLAHNTLQLFNR